MAMSLPKTGLAKFLKDGTRHLKGVEEAVERNIEACIELAGQVKSAYGPKGMNKMVINQHGKLFVTNDASTVLSELEVEHPAAKMLVLATQMQQKEVGDGTNAVVILAGALLENALELLKMGLIPIEIAEGYELAAEKALEFLPDLTVATVENVREADKVRAAIKTAISSKQYGYEQLLSDLVAAACVQILPANAKNFNVDNVRVCKILGSGISSSTVMNGMVFKRGAEGEIKSKCGGKIAVFSCPFDLTQTETKGTVLIQTAEELMNFSKGEENEVEKQVKGLHEAGVTVVVSGGKFGDLYTHFLNKYNIMAVRLNSKFDLRRLCRTVGAVAQPRIVVPGTEALGQCSEVYVDEVGDTEVVVFKQTTESGAVATLIIRASSENLMDDVERAIDDGVNTFKALTKDGRLVCGAGATEMELARRVESFGEKCAGLEQYAVKQFALALDTLPKLIADNAGLKATVLLSDLYAAHQKGESNAGVDIEEDSGGVLDAEKSGILDLYCLKYWMIKLAANAAATVLKVDTIIMSKQAGGPKPRDPKGNDPDED